MAAEYGLEADKCPHCGGTTRIEEHATLRWICSACGGPRVPVVARDDGTAMARTGAELRPLKKARAALLAGAASRGGALGLLVLALVLAGAGAYALTAAATMGIVLLACAVIAGVGTLSQRAKVRARMKEATTLVDEAWGRVAEDVLRASGRELTAAELARTMRIDDEAAETILSSLAVHDRARIDIGADAELRYSRIDAGSAVASPSPSTGEPEPDAQATAAAAARGAR